MTKDEAGEIWNALHNAADSAPHPAVAETLREWADYFAELVSGERPGGSSS